MKLTDFENEEALELLGNVIEPVSRIMTNKEFVGAVRSKKRIDAVKIALKEHKKDVIELLAALNGQKIEDYHANLIVMTKQLLELLNDEELIKVFHSQDQMISSVAFGPVTETTQGEEK